MATTTRTARKSTTTKGRTMSSTDEHGNLVPTEAEAAFSDATGITMATETNAEAADRILAEQPGNGVKVVSDAPATPKPRKPKPAAKKPITINGVTVQVAATLSNSEALKVARTIIAEQKDRDARKSGKGKLVTSETDRPAAAKRKGTKRNTEPKVVTKPTGKVAIPQNDVPTGSLRVRFSKTAYTEAIAGASGAEFRKANPGIAKATKSLDAKSAGSSVAYFAVLTLADVEKVVAHLRATSKAWAGMDKAPGMAKPLADNADRTAADAKAVAKK